MVRRLRAPQRTLAQDDDRRVRRGGEPTLSYEDVDTSLIPPRPRLYGLVGAEMIEEVWKERQAKYAANGRRPGATAFRLRRPPLNLVLALTHLLK